MKTNVWLKACRRPKGSRSGKYPRHGQDRSLWSVIVWWLVSHVLILTVSCRLWVKSILGGAVFRLEQIWGWATITWLHHLWRVLVYVDVTLTGTCSEAHQGVPTVVTLGMVLRSLTNLHPDRHSLALTRSCDHTLGVSLAAWLNYIRKRWSVFSLIFSNREQFRSSKNFFTMTFVKV